MDVDCDLRRCKAEVVVVGRGFGGVVEGIRGGRWDKIWAEVEAELDVGIEAEDIEFGLALELELEVEEEEEETVVGGGRGAVGGGRGAVVWRDLRRSG